MSVTFPAPISTETLNLNSTGNSNKITFQSANALTSSYNLVFPASLPTDASVHKQYAITTDNSGNLSFAQVTTGSGGSSGSTNNNNNNLSFSETFTASNNITSPASIPGLIVSGNTVFSLYIMVSLIANPNCNALYLLEGIQQTDNSWDLQQTCRGPSFPGIVFSMLNSGQIQYTSSNTNNFVSLTFNY